MPTETGEPITSAQIGEIYRTLIRPTLFDAAHGGESTPTLVLLGGQPGAGKSRASARLLEEHKGIVALTGDDLRIFHPRYRDLVTTQPAAAGAVLADATRPWVRAALQDALDQRQSLLLEGTFGDPDVTLRTAEEFRRAGFRVRIVAIASPRVLSVVTAASRYLRDRKAGTPARLTRLSAHDRGYAGTTRLIESLTLDLADRVTIISRKGTTLFDRNHQGEVDSAPFTDAVAALADGRNPSSWGARSSMELLGELKQITSFALAADELTADIAELLVEAHRLALSDVVPRLSVDANSPQARFIHDAVTEQLVSLNRSVAAMRTGAVTSPPHATIDTPWPSGPTPD